MIIEKLYDTKQTYVWNDVLESFDSWLDTIDELCEQRGDIHNVLLTTEIRALSLIASRIDGLLQGNQIVPLLPVFTVNQSLITDLAFMVNNWCGQPLNEQVSNDELNCLNEIHGKLSKLIIPVSDLK